MDPPPALRSGQLIMQTDAPAPSPFRDAWPRGLTCSDPVVGGRRLAHPAQVFDNQSADRGPYGPACGDAPLTATISLLGPCPRQFYPNSSLEHMPTEILLHILGFLDVNDLLSASRTSHLFRSLSLSPILHYYRLRRTRHVLPPLLSSPYRPSLANLIARSIFLTHTSIVSRRLARSLVSIRLSRRLAARPSAEALAERAVLPKECVPGMAPVHVSPAIVARRKAIEKEKVKDGLRRWIAAKWKGEVREREEVARKREESSGIGRVWRLRRFWERMSRGDDLVV